MPVSNETDENRNVAKKQIAQSFRGILRISPSENGDGGLDTVTTISVSDSMGNLCPLKLSQNAVEINGPLSAGTFTATSVTTGNLTVNSGTTLNGNTTISNLTATSANLTTANVGTLNITSGFNFRPTGGSNTQVNIARPNVGDILYSNVTGQYNPTNLANLVNDLIEAKIGGLKRYVTKTYYPYDAGSSAKQWREGIHDYCLPISDGLMPLEFPVNEKITIPANYIYVSHSVELYLPREYDKFDRRSPYDYSTLMALDGSWGWLQSGPALSDAYYGSGAGLWSTGISVFSICDSTGSFLVLRTDGKHGGWGADRDTLYNNTTSQGAYGGNGSVGATSAKTPVRKAYGRVRVTFLVND